MGLVAYLEVLMYKPFARQLGPECQTGELLGMGDGRLDTGDVRAASSMLQLYARRHCEGADVGDKREPITGVNYTEIGVEGARIDTVEAPSANVVHSCSEFPTSRFMSPATTTALCR